MENGIIRITPDREKAKSIIKMAETTLKMIEGINSRDFASNILKEYYDVIREFMATVLLLDGFKTTGEGAHKKLIEYIGKNYQFTEYEISLLNELRIIRNKISYNGFFITEDYLRRKKKSVLDIISKLRNIINRRLI